MAKGVNGTIDPDFEQVVQQVVLSATESRGEKLSGVFMNAAQSGGHGGESLRLAMWAWPWQHWRRAAYF